MQDIGYLTEFALPIKVHDHAGAGTSPITSTGVDMEGFDGVVFVTSLSVANAGNYMTAGHADADTGYAPTVAVANSGSAGNDLVLDVLHPLHRWVNVIVTVGSSSTVESIWAWRYRARTAPVVNGDAENVTKQFNAPATA